MAETLESRINMLGGLGTVFRRNGQIGARFEFAGLLDMAELIWYLMSSGTLCGYDGMDGVLLEHHSYI